MREHPFELRLCAALEARREVILGRQIGAGVHRPGNRILDVVLLEPGPEFDRRAAITAETIPPSAVHSGVGPGRARPWPPDDDWHPEAAGRVLEDAEAVGFFERELRNGTDYVRQTARYPDWFGQITGIENKPDLREPGTLAEQLRHDVRLGVVDRLVVATECHVTGAHLNRLPEPVGVWRYRPDVPPAEQLEVIRPAAQLPVREWGTEILAVDRDRADVRLASPDGKRRARIRIAERAYGKGWRTFSVPACEHAELVDVSGTAVPDCTWYEEAIDPRECGPACPAYSPGDPPPVDRAGERERRTPWRAAPPGRATRQSSIGDYDDGPDRSAHPQRS